MSGIGKLIIVVVCTVLIATGFAFLYNGETDSALDNRNILDVQDTVIVYHTYLNGIHALAGSVNAPSACFDLSQDVAVMESYPEQISIQLTSDKISDHCAQMIVPLPFAVTAQASDVAQIMSVYLDGESLDFILEEDTELVHIPDSLLDGVSRLPEIEDMGTSTDEGSSENAATTTELLVE